MSRSRLIAVLAALAVGAALADEGMWPFTNPPDGRLKLSKQWLEHVQRASVRFNSGGSGSFCVAGRAHSAGILEALRKVYRAEGLISELTGSRGHSGSAAPTGP